MILFQPNATVVCKSHERHELSPSQHLYLTSERSVDKKKWKVRGCLPLLLNRIFFRRATCAWPNRQTGHTAMQSWIALMASKLLSLLSVTACRRRLCTYRHLCSADHSCSARLSETLVRFSETSTCTGVEHECTCFCKHSAAAACRFTGTCKCASFVSQPQAGVFCTAFFHSPK